MNREMAQKAAKWWTQKIGGTPHFDNGCDDPMNAMAMVMAAMNANMVQPTDDALVKFESILTEKLVAIDRDVVFLRCDYSPDDILGDAANEAGVNTMRFPFKTGMHVHNDHVEVSDGYQAEWVTI